MRCTPQFGRLRFRGVHLRRSLRSTIGGRPLEKSRLTVRCCRGCVPPRMWGASTAAASGRDDARPLPFVWKNQPCPASGSRDEFTDDHPTVQLVPLGPQRGHQSAPTNRLELFPLNWPSAARRNGAGRRRRERRKKPGRNRRDPPRVSVVETGPSWRADQLPNRSVSGPLTTTSRWATTGGRRFLSKPHCDLSWILCRPGDPPGRNPPVVLSQKSEKSPIETSSMTAHRSAVTGPSNHWNSVVEVRASKHNSMVVSTDHHPPCSGPRRGPDSGEARVRLTVTWQLSIFPVAPHH